MTRLGFSVPGDLHSFNPHIIFQNKGGGKCILLKEGERCDADYLRRCIHRHVSRKVLFDKVACHILHKQGIGIGRTFGGVALLIHHGAGLCHHTHHHPIPHQHGLFDTTSHILNSGTHLKGVPGNGATVCIKGSSQMQVWIRRGSVVHKTLQGDRYRLKNVAVDIHGPGLHKGTIFCLGSIKG